MKNIDLVPFKKHKTITGRMYYNESMSAWSIIQLKKTLLEDYEELRNRRNKFSYEMFMSCTFDEIEIHLKAAKKQGRAPPLMIWFKKMEIEG